MIVAANRPMLQPGFVTMGELNNQPSPMAYQKWLAIHHQEARGVHIYGCSPEDFVIMAMTQEPIHWRYRFHRFLALHI